MTFYLGNSYLYPITCPFTLDVIRYHIHRQLSQQFDDYAFFYEISVPDRKQRKSLVISWKNYFDYERSFLKIFRGFLQKRTFPHGTIFQNSRIFCKIYRTKSSFLRSILPDFAQNVYEKFLL